MKKNTSTKRPRPGIQEVANVSGFSVSTVSRALNGYADVSAKTQAKVKQVALEIGYRPNYAATVLRSSRTMVVTYIASRPWTKFVDPFHLEMLDGLEIVLRENGYDLHVVMARGFDNEMEIIKRLVEQGRCDGLLFGRTKKQDARVDYLMERNFPFVPLGRTGRNDHDWIDRDHFQIGFEATRHLINLGHQRIALLSTPMQFAYSNAAKQGFRAALEEVGLEIDPALEAECSPELSGDQVVGKMLADGLAPTAIICGNDMIAIGVMEELRRLGIRPGKDMAVVGCDDIPVSSYLDPPLTTFTQDIPKASESMSRILLSRLSGRTHPETLTIPDRVGASLA